MAPPLAAAPTSRHGSCSTGVPTEAGQRGLLPHDLRNRRSHRIAIPGPSVNKDLIPLRRLVGRVAGRRQRALEPPRVQPGHPLRGPPPAGHRLRGGRGGRRRRGQYHKLRGEGDGEGFAVSIGTHREDVPR